MARHGRLARRRKAPAQHLLNIAMHDPCRSPSWRWDLAASLSEQGRRVPRTIDDRALIEAVRLRRTLARCTTERKRKSFERREPAFVEALSLHNPGGLECDRLQAWLLTGQPVHLVAQRCSLPTDVVTLYEELFFNVNLGARDWVLRKAVRWPPDGSWRQATVGDFWRLAGAQFGPHVLEHVLADIPSLGAVCELDGDLATEGGRTTIRVRLLVAALLASEQPVLDAAREMLKLVHKIEHDEAVNRDVKEALAPTAVAWEAVGNPRPPVSESQSAVSQPSSSAKLAADAA